MEKEGDIKIEERRYFEINKEIPRDEQKYIKLNEIYKGYIQVQGKILMH